MAEVIDLISSSSPPRADSIPPRRPATTAPTALPTAAAGSIFSDDSIDVSFFNYDLDKPNKRRRLSDKSPGQDIASSINTNTHVSANLNPNPNPVFLFSDDDPPALPTPGPAPSDSNLNSIPKFNLNLKTPSWQELESDPIVFTSSAPEPSVQKPDAVRKADFKRTNTITLDDDDGDGDTHIGNNKRGGSVNGGGRRIERDEIEDFSDQLAMPDLNDLVAFAEDTARSDANPSLSSRTANLLANLGSCTKAGGGRAVVSKTTSRSQRDDILDPEDLSDDMVELAKPKPAKASKKTTTKGTSAEKEAKAREREAAKAQREREKQLEKERKQKLKEEKAKEKQLAQDIMEVNKLKVDKKESTPEMLIDIASSLEETSVGNQTTEFMTRLGVEFKFFSSMIPNIVKWRRKVTAEFNETLGYWEPCPHHIREEEHVLCLVEAQEFVDMVIAPAAYSSCGTDNLDQHVLRIKSAYPGCKPIYLIEGLTPWMRKNQNSRNRAYQAEVRRQFNDQNEASSSSAPTTASGRPRKKTNNKPETTPPVDDDTIEDALLQLQVAHSCLIHHTTAAPDTAEWIKNFTEHVSTIPYRRERMDGNDSAFCMDSGQVKPGEDKPDTFVKMLQEVNRVTASMAYGIIPKYPSVTDLVSGMRSHGPLMLEDVKKSANKNGALTDSRIGPAASKRLYKVFTGLDPLSTDI